MRILVPVFCIWALAYAEVLKIPNIPGDNSDYVHARHGHILHRLRRANVPTKTPEIIKYYDADSLVSRVTIISENGIPLKRPVVYENTAFKAGPDGYLVKTLKRAEPEETKLKEDEV